MLARMTDGEDLPDVHSPHGRLATHSRQIRTATVVSKGANQDLKDHAAAALKAIK